MAIDKNKLRKEFQKNWKKYYNLDFFKRKGYVRKICKKCKQGFWTQVKDKEICNDSSCLGKFTFIGKSPAKRKMDLVETWYKFSETFGKLGYTEIPRYPVIARWRGDTWFTQASIYCFQPYVVSGQVKPPANPLVIAQPSLRFNDIDNVGVTSSHYTMHIHMGQHSFQKPSNYKPSLYLSHIHKWLIDGLKINPKEIDFKEEVWAGGGNFGPCIEYFVGGLELGNQVYMMFKETPKGRARLGINVLDHGGGLERQAWITHGTPTSYEIAFDPVDNKYLRKLGLKYNKKILSKFMPYAGLLNVDEVSDIEKAWKNVASKINVNVSELKKNIEPLKAFYSVLDHSRALLFALGDGALPSNSGGGYNLRFILRRALKFIEDYNWNLDLKDLAREHMKVFTGSKGRRVLDREKHELSEVGLRPLYSELEGKLPVVENIIENELKKYNETKNKKKIFIGNFFKKVKKVDEKSLIEAYTSHGVFPEELAKAGAKVNVKVDVPSDFYSKVGELHSEPKKEMKIKESMDYKDTKKLYYADEYAKQFEAKVLGVVKGRYVILDKTLFYPSGGGQIHDTGTLNNIPVVGVEMIGNVIVHELEKSGLKKGEKVVGKIDWDRRYEIMRNHLAVHVVNGAAKHVLGEHIWQAGSDVKEDKARLDITHFESLDWNKLREIERLANEIVLENIKVEKAIVNKGDAEKKYGFRLYQGGAVPGSSLRVKKISWFDVEACGGTHVNNTGECGHIKILNSKTIQDGVIRLEFVAGKSALKAIQKSDKYLKDSSEVFRVPPDKLAKTCLRFFEEWKKYKKLAKKS